MFNWPDDYIDQIIQGDALSVLRSMPVGRDRTQPRIYHHRTQTPQPGSARIMRKYQGDNRSELGTIVVTVGRSLYQGGEFKVEVFSRPSSSLKLNLTCNDIRINDNRPGKHEKQEKIFQNYMHAIKRMNEVAQDLEEGNVSETGAADELKMVATILKEIVSKSNMWFK